ncbi:unnamed protein product [Trichogramma brassicae]|uniref:Uncharacterized protein n=1 Tax=Trichogramma brassicae TaxID=86971 RepID=A0A6H5IZJ9_9HYME|nr:unnamed protein product [Trichogramma brassicae]
MEQLGKVCLKRLKRLREKANWKIKKERQELFNQLHDLIYNWTGKLPNLWDIFRPEEMDWILAQAVKNYNKPNSKLSGESIMKFVIGAGYKDRPEIDDDGKPLLRRTTAVHYAAEKYDRCILDLFEIYDRFDVNYVDNDGLSHFHVACMYNCRDVVKKFLEFGQDPNSRVQQTGDSPLHLALSREYIEVVELLLENGADPNSANKKGMTALHIISDQCYLYEYIYNELAEAFFKIIEGQRRTIQLEARDNLGRTPLELAVATLTPELVTTLLDRDLNFTTRSRQANVIQILVHQRLEDNLAEVDRQPTAYQLPESLECPSPEKSSRHGLAQVLLASPPNFIVVGQQLPKPIRLGASRFRQIDVFRVGESSRRLFSRRQMDEVVERQARARTTYLGASRLDLELGVILEKFLDVARLLKHLAAADQSHDGRGVASLQLVSLFLELLDAGQGAGLQAQDDSRPTGPVARLRNLAKCLSVERRIATNQRPYPRAQRLRWAGDAPRPTAAVSGPTDLERRPAPADRFRRRPRRTSPPTQRRLCVSPANDVQSSRSFDVAQIRIGAPCLSSSSISRRSSLSMAQCNARVARIVSGIHSDGPIDVGTAQTSNIRRAKTSGVVPRSTSTSFGSAPYLSSRSTSSLFSSLKARCSRGSFPSRPGPSGCSSRNLWTTSSKPNHRATCRESAAGNASAPIKNSVSIVGKIFSTLSRTDANHKLFYIRRLTPSISGARQLVVVRSRDKFRSLVGSHPK